MPRTLYITTLLALLLTGCRELPAYFDSGHVVARVGEAELRATDLTAVLPASLKGEDSISYADAYVDKWIRKQLKLRQATTELSASVEDIDRMVEEYRQTLLIRKLDQAVVDRMIDTCFTDDEIAAYYQAHKADFRLDRTIVKGRILQFDVQSRQASKLLTLMRSPSSARQKDLQDLCEKNGYRLENFNAQWIDFTEYLNHLPTLRSQNYDRLLRTGEVQQMRDSYSNYYFQIDEILRVGEPNPLERVRETIRRILFNRRQSEVLRTYEEQMLQQAMQQGEVKIYQNNV